MKTIQPSFLYFEEVPFKLGYNKNTAPLLALCRRVFKWDFFPIAGKTIKVLISVIFRGCEKWLSTIKKNYRKEFVFALLFSVGFIPSKAHAQTITTPVPQLSDPMVALQPIQAISGAVPIADTTLSEVSPVAVPAPVVAAPVAYTGNAGCVTGVTVPDYYENLVMQKESGGNSCAMNPSGACGLFQALPCSKMGCSLADVTCQEAWGENYIQSVYGSSQAAWNSELTRGWY